MLLARDVELAGGQLTGRAFETDFASFQWWLGTGFPDPAIRNIFGMAAVRGADGGFLLGVMGGHTVNAGSVYFPAGTPDPGDVSGGRLDLAGSVVRELREETGLEAAAFAAEPGWTVVLDGPRVALMRTFLADETCASLVERARAHIAIDPGAELADVIAVRRIGDLPPAAPTFVRAYLEASFAK
ncbi:MAG: NUDIX hydrolase [Bacteroidales bacterium]|nr:NUDIX hydrolase [Bacteroidales bacterium]